MKLYVLSFAKEREIFKPEFFLTSEAAYERMLQSIKEDTGFSRDDFINSGGEFCLVLDSMQEDFEVGSAYINDLHGSNYAWQIHAVDLPSEIIEKVYRERELNYYCEDVIERLTSRLEEAEKEGKKLKYEQNIRETLNDKASLNRLSHLFQNCLEHNDSYFEAYWESLDLVLAEAHLGKEEQNETH